LPPIRHGRFTLNIEESVLRRDNSARYDHVVLDEWETDGTFKQQIAVPLSEPIQSSDLVHLINGLNSGRIPSRFVL
jgi:hypothetical protein